MQTSGGQLCLATHPAYFPKGIMKIPLSGDLILTPGADPPQTDPPQTSMSAVLSITSLACSF